MKKLTLASILNLIILVGFIGHDSFAVGHYSSPKGKSIDVEKAEQLEIMKNIIGDYELRDGDNCPPQLSGKPLKLFAPDPMKQPVYHSFAFALVPSSSTEPFVYFDFKSEWVEKDNHWGKTTITFTAPQENSDPLKISDQTKIQVTNGRLILSRTSNGRVLQCDYEARGQRPDIRDLKFETYTLMMKR